MLSLMLAPTLAAALLAPTPAPAVADSFESAYVPSGATWVAHLDVAGVRASRLFAMAQEHGLDLNDPDFAEVERELGINPVLDIDAITLFGSPHDVETPVALVATNAKADHALQKLAQHVSRSTVQVGDLTITRWEGDGDGPGFSYLARKGEDRLLIVSPSKTAVAQGVAVLKGDMDSLADDGPDGALGGSGALFFFSAGAEVTEAIPDMEDLAPVAKLVQHIAAELGESGDDVYAKVTLGTSEARHATQIAAIVEGGRAALNLAAEMEPEVKQILPLLDGVHVEVFGNDVTLALTLPLDFLQQLAESDGTWADIHAEEDEYSDYSAAPDHGDDEDGWH